MTNSTYHWPKLISHDQTQPAMVIKNHADLASVSPISRSQESLDELTLAVAGTKHPRIISKNENDDFAPMKMLSMLSPEETILEIVLRRKTVANPSLGLLRGCYEALKQVQCLREEGQNWDHELVFVDHVLSSLKEKIDVFIISASTAKGRLCLYGKENVMGDDTIILSWLQQILIEVNMWWEDRCSSRDNVQLEQIPKRISPRDLGNFVLNFTPMMDVSLLSLEERQQEVVLRKQIRQNPQQVALYHQYNQLQRHQWMREFEQDKLESDIVIKAFQMDLWATEIDASPLSRRAWTLQERLLSTRVLHFTQNQIFWECQSSKACETWPKMEPKTSPQKLRAKDTDLEASKHTHPLDGAPLDPLDQHWDEIVEIYTDANLTRPEDKLVAISGLAKEIQARKKDAYYAGLWGKSFASNLLYCLEVPQRPPSFDYRAPSWSWASVNGKVHFIVKHQKQTTLASKILRIWTLGADAKRGSFGKIKDGFFEVSAPTSEILRYEKHGSSHQILLTEESSDRVRLVDFFPDTIFKTIRKDTICLPILYYNEAPMSLENRTSFWLAGLVLQPVEDGRDEYRRLGVFRMNEQSGRKWFERITWRTISVV